MITKFVSALALVALLIPAVSFAHEDTALEAGAGVEVNVNGSDDTNGDTSTSSPLQGSAGDDSNANTSTSGSGSLKVNALGVTVMSSGQVTNTRDLEVYRENLRMQDENVAATEIHSDNKLSVEYWHPGHLFGVFPVKVKSSTTVSVSETGEAVVKTQMPWWNFLVSGTGSIAAAIDGELSTEGSISSDIKMGADAAAKARIIEAVAHANTHIASPHE